MNPTEPRRPIRAEIKTVGHGLDLKVYVKVYSSTEGFPALIEDQVVPTVDEALTLARTRARKDGYTHDDIEIVYLDEPGLG